MPSMSSTPVRRVPSLAFLALLALPTAAQNLRLNAPLAREVSGWIGGPASADGQTLVYPADRDAGPGSELYALPADARGGPLRLSGTLAGDGYVSVQFTQEGKGVLFLDDLDGNGSVELALVPIDGGAPPRAVSGPLVPGRNVQSVQPSRDELHCVYLADQDADEVFELFAVSVSGAAVPVKLNGSLVAGGDVQGFVLSDDGRRVLYSADQDADEVVELFVAPVDGSAPARKLPIPLVAGGDVVFFQLDPGAVRVSYLADQAEDERFELFTIPSDGSQAPSRLSGVLVPGGDVATCRLSPDGRWVVYEADQDTDEHFEIYGVPADGSRAAVKLSTPSDREPVLHGLSHDSACAVYQSDPSGTHTLELFSVPIDGSAPSRRISGPMVAGGDAYFPAFSHDSSRVVYAADQDANDVFELYSAPIDGSAPPVKLNAPLPPGGDVAVSPFNLLPGFYVMAAGVMYEADQEVDGLGEVYFAPLAGGGAPRKLVSGPSQGAYPAYANRADGSPDSPPRDFGRVYFWRERALFSVGVEPGAEALLIDEARSSRTVGSVRRFLLSPSGERAVYHAREDGDGDVGELYSIPTEKPSERVQLRSGLAPGRFPSVQLFTPDEERVVYLSLSLLPSGGSTGLYSEPVYGSAAPVQLDIPPARGVRSAGSEDFDTLVLLPDGRQLVFLAGLDSAPASTGLFLVPVDGSSPPRLLSGDEDVLLGVECSADGSRIAFRSIVGTTVGLFVVPSDASAPARRVDAGGPRVPEFDYRLSPDGERVFYRTLEEPGKGELFVASSDASVAPLRLNGPLQSQGDVTAFALDPLGLRVVYLADAAIDEVFELYTVLADGSAAPERLHAPLSGALDVTDFQVSADGRRVAFRGDLRTDDVLELFSAPLDARRPPVRLSANLGSDGDVLDYRLGPDGKVVVYRADPTADGLVELFSTPIEGSRGQARLSRPLIPGGSVASFQISADSRSVAFTAERLDVPPPLGDPGPPSGDSWRPLTLLTVPIRGQQKAAVIAGPFQGTGTVSAYQLSADGGVVVYRADQDETHVDELYAAWTAHGPVSLRAARR
jgi:Tol biopolymer transport system component